MLAPERQTPRPRPPALVRRSPPKRATLQSEGVPPPPYALEFPSLEQNMESNLSDSVSADTKAVGVELGDISPVTKEDVNTKGKAELDDLFLRAEKIIKAREQELSVAASLGKTLLETNEALKLRHDALLSRIPAMQSPTSANSTIKPPRNDTWSTTDDEAASSSVALSRIHSRTNSIISSVQGSPAPSRTSSIIGTTPSTRRGHVRRISASPSALLALSETNEELIAELTRLHNTTDAAQIEGAQRLRKLEREIGGLKAELEATQRTNAELEEKVKEKVDEERRREREERLKRIRGGEGPDDDEANEEEPIRDFAPPGNGGQKWDSVPVTPHINRVMSPVVSDSEADESNTEVHSLSGVSAASSRPVSQANVAENAESALIAQLCCKVLELREANAELSARNRVTKQQLAHAEREAFEIKKLYEAIGEELAEDERRQDDDFATMTRGSGGAKSSSWSFRLHRDQFSDDMRRPTQGSYGSLGSKILYHGTRAHKSRIPLSDNLFSPPASAASDKADKTTPSVVLFPSTPRSKQKVRPKPKEKTTPSRSPKPAPRLSPANSLAFRRDPSGMYSSSLSSRSSVQHSLLEPPAVRRRRGRHSLGSELGSEFGDDWGGAPSSHSLFDDDSLHALSEPETGGYSDAEDEDLALAALRGALTPPLVGRLLEHDEHILPVGSLQSSPGDAFHLVAHAVVARPTRWLDSDDHRAPDVGPRAALPCDPSGEDPWETTRYPDIDPAAEAEERASVRMQRRDAALERMESTAHMRSMSSSSSLPSSAPQLTTKEADASRRGGLVESIKRTSAEVLIELWIFLQFVVVICIFLYTMGRRGPREVLGAPRRRS